MRKVPFRRPVWALAFCLASTLTAMPLAAQPESLLLGSNRNVGATAANASIGPQFGPQMAVNPNNANQIVAVADTSWGAITAQCDEPVAVFYSGDGGTTWQAACAPGIAAYTNLGAQIGNYCYEYLYGSDPVVAWDNANRVYLSHTWICTGRSSFGASVVSARSTDAGATWSAHSVIADGWDPVYFFGTLEEKSSYIVDNSPASPFYGRHYTCWDSFNYQQSAWSSDGGATWNKVDLPASPGGSADVECEMAVEDNGTVHVLFESMACVSGVCSADVISHTHSTDGGATWSTPVVARSFNLVRSASANCPHAQDQRCIRPFGPIAVDNSGGACDGHLYAAFTDYAAGGNVNHSDVFITKSANGGATWSAPVKVNDDGLPNRVQFHPALEVDASNGHVVVAWHDARNHVANNAVDIFTARSTDCGASFGANVQTSQPSLEFNNSGISSSTHNSVANPGYGYAQTGDHLGLDVRNGKAYVAWTDTRHYFPSFTTEPQKENIGFSVVSFAGGASSVCGNNVREAGEACDGSDLGGETCQGLTFTHGTLSCKANCSFDTAGCSIVYTTTTFTSVAAEDGYILESDEFSGSGGTVNSTDNSASGLRAGDDRKRKQFRSILSFDTAALPDGAAVQSVTLRLRRGTVVGTNPFTIHGNLSVILHSSGFNGNVALETADFQAFATFPSTVCTLSSPANDGDWSECTFSMAAVAALNKTGKTQLRIAFSTDDDNDNGDDYIGFYSSNNATAANHPQLVVTYQ